MSAADNVNAYKTEGHRHSAELEQELPGRGAASPSSRTSCPSTRGCWPPATRSPSAALSKDEVRELFHDAYAGEPFVDVVDEPPRTADVRDTNRARVYAR